LAKNLQVLISSGDFFRISHPLVGNTFSKSSHYLPLVCPLKIRHITLMKIVVIAIFTSADKASNHAFLCLPIALVYSSLQPVNITVN